LTAAPDELGLFPLGTVLFPGGSLSLRIFEPRYVALIRDCAAAGQPFGVLLIARGHEAGVPAEPHPVGTLASIVDFTTLPDGLLGIRCVGGRRFRLLQRRVREDGLALGRIALLSEDPAIVVPPEHGLLATLLRRASERVEDLLPGARHADFDDAAWVAWRLGEILPLEPLERQQLLETDDPAERLALLARWLPRFQR
jgi:Lon protease-like protein